MFAELPSAWIDFDIISNFDNDEFEADEEVKQSEIWQNEVIGVDGIESDIAFSADLGIGAAWFFEMEREGSGHNSSGWLSCSKCLAIARIMAISRSAFLGFI